MGAAESGRPTAAEHKKRAYDLHPELSNLENNYAEDARSFFYADCATWSLPPHQQRPSSINVGTDCSGIEIPMITLRVCKYLSNTCLHATTTRRFKRPSKPIALLLHYTKKAKAEMSVECPMWTCIS